MDRVRAKRWISLRVKPGTRLDVESAGVLLYIGGMQNQTKQADQDAKDLKEMGYAVENYDSARAKAELDRRGLNPRPGSSAGAWAFADPDGFQLEVAG